MQKIATFLCFDSNAEEAVNFYLSIFKNSKITQIERFTEAGPGPAGSVMLISFELNGQGFMALNAGPQFKFTEAVSLMVMCEDQAEIDFYWHALSAGGSEVQCGWLKDKFGFFWQVAPSNIGELIRPPAAMLAMMKMKKLDIATLEQAASR